MIDEANSINSVSELQQDTPQALSDTFEYRMEIYELLANKVG